MLTGGGSLTQPARVQKIAIEQLRDARRWTVPFPAVIDRDETGICIDDLFAVKRGIATGANDFFILDRTRAHDLGLPEEVLRPLLPKVRQLPTDEVAARSDGYPDLEPQLCLLDCDLSDSQVRQRYPRLSDYLTSADGTGIRERNLVRHRRPWYRQEQREPAPYLCTYMGRGQNGSPPLRFIWNRSKAVATNTYLFLYPKAALAELLQSDDTKARDVFELLKRASRDTMGTAWRTHAGGMHKIEPGDLRRVKLSSPPTWITAAVQRVQPLLATSPQLR